MTRSGSPGSSRRWTSGARSSMLSNSDPCNHDPGDRFFDDLYGAWTIERVPARRSINCRGDRRGEVAELLIRNYG